MYQSFYGLSERPFDLTPDPRFLFLAPRHREALSTLRFGLSTPRGLTVLLGEAGTGKTTLVRTALASWGESNGRFVLVTNPTLTRDEFYEYLAPGFGLSRDAVTSKSRFLVEFQRDLEVRFRADRPSALLIDEAQCLSHDLLEEVRLLTNIETETTKLLNVVLVGQPELAERLNGSTLCQLKQRVTLRCRLEPLDLAETAAYIAVRLRRAGGSPAEIFTKRAVERVFRASRGIPRTVNVLCDNALIGGFAAQMKPVDVDMVEEACRDFDLCDEAASADQTATTPGAHVQPAHENPRHPLRVTAQPPAPPGRREGLRLPGQTVAPACLRQQDS